MRLKVHVRCATSRTRIVTSYTDWAANEHVCLGYTHIPQGRVTKGSTTLKGPRRLTSAGRGRKGNGPVHSICTTEPDNYVIHSAI